MRLTDQQIDFYNTFGFLKFPGLFKDEASDIINAFEQVWAQHGGGHNQESHDGKYRSAMLQFIDRNEYLSALIDEPRINEVSKSILGDDYNYMASDGNYYVGDSPWHSDGYSEKKYRSFKIAFYLDRVTRDTGCLRVIPGSHRYGEGYADVVESLIHENRSPGPEVSLGLTGSEVPAVALESEPGDMVLFNHLIKHASFGGSDRRRMFTINLHERYEDEDIGELRQKVAGSASFWVDTAYGEIMVRTAGPERMRHLEQYLANQDHLPELAKKARREMREPSRGGGFYEKQES